MIYSSLKVLQPFASPYRSVFRKAKVRNRNHSSIIKILNHYTFFPNTVVTKFHRLVTRMKISSCSISETHISFTISISAITAHIQISNIIFWCNTVFDL